MRPVITLTALVLLAIPAPAEACHRFSRWWFPYPQRCSAAHWTPRAALRVISPAAAAMPAMGDAPSAGDIAMLTAAMVVAVRGRVWP